MVILSVLNVDHVQVKSVLLGWSGTYQSLTHLFQNPPNSIVLSKKIQTTMTQNCGKFWRDSDLENSSPSSHLTTGVTGCSISSKVCRSASLRACVTEGTMRPEWCWNCDGQKPGDKLKTRKHIETQPYYAICNLQCNNNERATLITKWIVGNTKKNHCKTKKFVRNGVVKHK